MQNKLKKTKMFRSLTTTLVFAFLALIVVIILISSCLNIYFRLQTQEKVIDGQQQLIAQKAADAVSNYILQKFSELESGVRLGDLGITSQEEEESAMKKLIGLESAFRRLILLNAQGEETVKVSRLSSFASDQSTETLDDPFFLETSKEQRYISSIYVDNVTSEPLVLIAVPIKDVFDDFKGVLVAELNLKFMWDLVDSIKVGDTGVAYVVDMEGDLIAFGDTSRVLKGENLVHLDEVYEFVGGNESLYEGKSEISKGILGNDVVTTHVCLGSPDWAVVVELPVEEAYEDVNQELRLTALVVFLCIVLAVVISVYLSKRITKPIIKLRDATNKVGEGNLDVNIEVSGKNEIGQLARDFSQMTDNLKKSKNELLEAQKDLERKVEQRTKEINEKVNELEKSEAATLNIMEDLQKTVDTLKETQTTIELQNIQLKKLDRIKSDFLNITSHELRTPMSAIKGYIQMIMKRTLGEITEEQKQALNVIVRNTNRLDNLIQDILDISRLESGTMKFISEPTNIQQMVNEAIETTHSLAETKTIHLHAEVEENLPPIVIDKERIKQVILNLINNAIKFSPNGSTIILRVKKETNNILYEVQDHGRGIPKEHQAKIFDTFYQVDSGMDRKFGGAGLGLSIARGIVLSHGGNIWVESTGTLGEGSTFKFTLPLIPVHDLEGKFREVDIFRLKDAKKTIENDLRNKTVIWEEETKEKGE